MKENYNFNPFSGVLDHEINHTIVPKFSIAEIVSYIENNQSVAIEFLGKQGRGKTTHLVWLQQQLPHYPIFLLDKNPNSSEVIEHVSDVVFVDSIHHFSFAERIKLFKAKRVVIYTTHSTRKFACMLGKKQLKIIRFKGIDTDILRQIIDNRLLLAQKDPQLQRVHFSESELQKLVKTYGDNYRGIINKLYEKYK